MQRTCKLSWSDLRTSSPLGSNANSSSPVPFGFENPHKKRNNSLQFVTRLTLNSISSEESYTLFICGWSSSLESSCCCFGATDVSTVINLANLTEELCRLVLRLFSAHVLLVWVIVISQNKGDVEKKGNTEQVELEKFMANGRLMYTVCIDESYLVDNMTSLNTVPIKKKKAPSDGYFMVT